MTYLQFYDGSLDFPCDFCGENSYKNFQICDDEEGKLIIFCDDCLAKARVRGKIWELKEK